MTITYLDDIERIQYKFTELGQTISDLSKTHEGYFEETVESLSEGFTELRTVYADPAFSETLDASGILASQIAQMYELFGKVLTGVSDSFDSLLQSSKDAQKGIVDISDALKSEAEKPAGSQGPIGGFGVWYEDRAKKKSTKKGSKLPKLVQREVSSAKSSFNAMLGKLKVPKPGHIAAGAIGIMAYGFMHRDRVRKEAGEIKNTLESAFDYGISSVRRKGTAAFSSLQESLQRYTGIAKEEVQAITTAFAQGGVGIQEMLDTTDKSFGRVGKSAVHSTLALDKMFGVPGGTTAQKAVSYMHNYGMSLSEANEMTRDLYLNDQAFSVGVPVFVQNVETAAESLKDLGFSIRGVMDVAGQLQKGFEAIGVPRQFAGKLAGMGVQQMAQGIANMSDDWKVLLGQRMFQKTGLEALQKFEESFTRVKEGNSTEEYKKLILEMYQLARDTNKGDESEMYAFLSRNVGLGSYGARAVLEVGKTMEEKGGVAALKATEKHMATFKDAFKTEKEKDSQFRQEMNKWMDNLSQVGQGLLGIIGKFLAHLIATFRAYPHMFSALVKLDFDRLRRIQKQIAGLSIGIGKDIAMLKKGASGLKDSAKTLFGDIFASSIDAMGDAFTADFSGSDIPKSEDRPMSYGPSHFVQTVYIPVGGGGGGKSNAGQTYAASLDPIADSAAQEYADKTGTSWVGGGLSLMSRGVDEHGNIGLDIVGNCPRCGFIFGDGTLGAGSQPAGAAEGGAWTSLGLEGEGKYTSKDVEAAARVLQTEMGGYRKQRHNEALGILQTLMNRGGRKGNDRIYKAATGKGGWGKQGKLRAYGTRKKPGGKTIDFVRKFLRGEEKVPEHLKRAKSFFHARQGDVFKKHSDGKKVYEGNVPYFARQKGGQGIIGSEEARPGYRAFFTAPKVSDTSEGREGRQWLSRGTPRKSHTGIDAGSTQEAQEASMLEQGRSILGWD